MRKHTPGPWEVSAGDIWPVSGAPRVKIASTIKPSPMNGINWEANASLLAAAPCMLDALEYIVDAMTPEDWDALTEYAQNKILHAIAKARGEEPHA